MKKIVLCLMVVIQLGCMSGASAHLAGGEDRDLGEVIEDFGYDPSPIVAGEGAFLSFNFVRKQDQMPAPPASLWVRISQDDDILFSGTLAPEAEHMVLSYVFPRAGRYQILTRFEDNDKKREEVFTLEVQKRTSSETSPWVAAGMVGGLLLLNMLLITWYQSRKRKQSTH